MCEEVNKGVLPCSSVDGVGDGGGGGGVGVEVQMIMMADGAA